MRHWKEAFHKRRPTTRNKLRVELQKKALPRHWLHTPRKRNAVSPQHSERAPSCLRPTSRVARPLGERNMEQTHHICLRKEYAPKVCRRCGSQLHIGPISPV